MAIIFSIINNKGGTGKTTTAHNLGVAFSRRKKKVLLIDFDSQCNLSAASGVMGVEPNICDVLLGKIPIQESIKTLKDFSIIPSSDKLLDTESLMNAEPGREYILKENLEKIKNDFDIVLIDCPPSLGTLSTNSLVAANYFIVPMQAENFAFIGLDRILHVTEKVHKRLNPTLELAGILFVKLASRTKFSQAVITNLSANSVLSGKLFNTFIRQDIALMECGAFQQSVFEYAPKGRGAVDYMELANEILRKYGKK